MRLLRGNGDGTLQASVSYGNIAPVAVAVADLDGDGRLDVVAADFTDTISVFRSAGCR